MRNSTALTPWVSLTLTGSLLFAQTAQRPVFRANVRMVSLAFSVTDNKGNPVAGLKPEDVRILENGVPQRIAVFSEGSRTVFSAESRDFAAGASVFILFDTSNRMYTMFPYVYDAIAEFVRRLDTADSVAIYTFSRNLSRAARLTNDHLQARAGLTNAVAGDDTALFNSILLTLRDAAKAPGRKAVVVFSNGSDNASMVAPYDVARVAENEGIPVYIISTQDPSKDQPLAGALEFLTGRSGGKLYWVPRWQDQSRAFQSIREEIADSYTAYYYSQNSGSGFRRIEVGIAPANGRNYHVRVRSGYEARSDSSQSEDQ